MKLALIESESEVAVFGVVLFDPFLFRVAIFFLDVLRVLSVYTERISSHPEALRYIRGSNDLH